MKKKTTKKTPAKKAPAKKPGPKKGSPQKGGNHKKRITKNLILKAIEGSGGIKTVIAQRAGISRGSLYNALEEWPDLDEKITAEAETIKDLAESEIIKQIRAGSVPILIFFAKTRMKDRGYVEKSELDLNVSKTPALNIFMGEESEDGS